MTRKALGSSLLMTAARICLFISQGSDLRGFAALLKGRLLSSRWSLEPMAVPRLLKSPALTEPHSLEDPVAAVVEAEMVATVVAEEVAVDMVAVTVATVVATVEATVDMVAVVATEEAAAATAAAVVEAVAVLSVVSPVTLQGTAAKAEAEAEAEVVGTPAEAEAVAAISVARKVTSPVNAAVVGVDDGVKPSYAFMFQVIFSVVHL